jgi:GntR family transcriptional regulator/MocR family aminotransferase
MIALAPGAGAKRHRLAAAIADAVRDGRLKPGARLPASRDLAVQLGVSRGVVTDAYAQLVAQGFLAVRPRRAPTIAAGAHEPVSEPSPPRPREARYDFTATTPDVTIFPRGVWRRAVDTVLRTAPDVVLDYGDPYGAEPLRAVLAERLGRVRGVVTAPRRLVIVQGFAQGIDVVCATLVARGRTRLAVEDPALDDAVATARLAGMEVVGVPVDGDGIDVDALARIRADAVLVTPAHQFPTGVVLTPQRRRALLEWARRTDALVIEDDYDAEFRHDGPPLGTLQGLAPNRVAYIGTASKALAPALRLGWLALPAPLAAEAASVKWYRDSGSPMIDQLALAEVISSGAFDRSLRRALRTYRARRDRLVAELHVGLPSARISGAAAGLHLVLELDRSDEEQLATRAAAQRINVRGLRSYAVTPSTDATAPARLALGYGRLPEPAIADAVLALAEIVAESGRAGRYRRYAGSPSGP